MCIRDSVDFRDTSARWPTGASSAKKIGRGHSNQTLCDVSRAKSCPTLPDLRGGGAEWGSAAARRGPRRVGQRRRRTAISWKFLRNLQYGQHMSKNLVAIRTFMGVGHDCIVLGRSQTLPTLASRKQERKKKTRLKGPDLSKTMHSAQSLDWVYELRHSK